MKPPDVSRVVWLVVLLGLVLGCDGSPQAPVSHGPQSVKVDELPELDEPIGPLDEQRIKVAPPKGWHIPSRSSRWIVRFTASDQVSYPSIIVTAEDYESIFNVSKENMDEFAKQIAAGLRKGKSPAKQTMAVAPIEIGRFVGISYRRRGKAPYGFKRVIVERLILDTVVAGRKYSIELRTRDGDLDRYRRHLLAVAEGIEFLEPEAEPKVKTPGRDSEFEPIEEDEVERAGGGREIGA